jgi:hypothetical protein
MDCMQMGGRKKNADRDRMSQPNKESVLKYAAEMQLSQLAVWHLGGCFSALNLSSKLYIRLRSVERFFRLFSASQRLQPTMLRS